MKPPFTPLEALEMGEGTFGDYEVTLEGAMMSPRTEWFPVATHTPTQTEYVPTGEETTGESEWISL